MRFAADFETTTDPQDCRVWAWGLCDIDEPDTFEYGNDLETLFDKFKKKSAKLYFHNLKFDGEFILYYLFRHGFRHVETKDELEAGTFITLISELGQWYQIKICFQKKGRRVVYLTILDSLKVLPFSVDVIAKSFRLPMMKGSIDYTAPRPPGHALTTEEVDYLRNDCQIVARALGALFAQELTAMTAGSNALKDFKRIIDGDNVNHFAQLFPAPDYDHDVRQAYRGGFTFLAARYRNRSVKAGIVLDVNSLYPSVMYYKPLPFGEGLFFNGEYEPDPVYPLYVQMLTCQFKLKPKHIPTIQLKGNTIFNPVEYIERSPENDPITLCLSSVDLDLVRDHYDIWDVTYHSGWKFKEAVGLFCPYIDKWTAVKIESKQTGNGGMYTLSKLMLNSLYGKFALNPQVRSKFPEYDAEADRVIMRTAKPETRPPVYIPVGLFITSYARNVTIRAAQSLYDRFVYADTDSLHLIGTDIPEGLDIDPVRLGAWSHERTFSKAHYVRAKAYIEVGHDPGKDEPDRLRVTCAGLPVSCHDQVTFANFRPGARYRGKLRPRHVPGGIVLESSDYNMNVT